MTKLTLTVSILGLVALGACSPKIDPSTAPVRNGPQVQNPYADAPGGKLPSGSSNATPVIIDDTGAQPRSTGSIVITDFS